MLDELEGDAGIVDGDRARLAPSTRSLRLASPMARSRIPTMTWSAAPRPTESSARSRRAGECLEELRPTIRMRHGATN